MGCFHVTLLSLLDTHTSYFFHRISKTTKERSCILLTYSILILTGSSSILVTSIVPHVYVYIYIYIYIYRGSVRSTRGLGPTMTARGQGIGISIGMLPQTLIMSITVKKTSKYYTAEFDFEEGF